MNSLIAQENDEILFTLEYHYGINANAFASDDIRHVDKLIGTVVIPKSGPKC